MRVTVRPVTTRRALLTKASRGLKKSSPQASIATPKANQPPHWRTQKTEAHSNCLPRMGRELVDLRDWKDTDPVFAFTREVMAARIPLRSPPDSETSGIDATRRRAILFLCTAFLEDVS